MHAAIASHLSNQQREGSQAPAFMIVPTPIVTARRGTAASPKKSAAASTRVILQAGMSAKQHGMWKLLQPTRSLLQQQAAGSSCWLCHLSSVTRRVALLRLLPRSLNPM
jgi:hypothetical protein